MPSLCVSLVDAEGLHEAEGEPVAPQDYTCRSTTGEAELSDRKPGKDEKEMLVDREI